jgi:hypothetical protein
LEASPGKNLTRPMAGCGEVCLSSQLCGGAQIQLQYRPAWARSAALSVRQAMQKGLDIQFMRWSTCLASTRPQVQIPVPPKKTKVVMLLHYTPVQHFFFLLTQGLALAGQVFHYLSHTLNPFALVILEIES